jgi:protein TonB
MQAQRHMNGHAQASLGGFAAAGSVPYDDPMSRVLGLDAKTSSVAAWFGFTSAGTMLLLWLMALSLLATWWRAQHIVVPHEPNAEIEILRDETPPPPPPPAPVETAKAEVTPPPARSPHEAPPPPPAPAQAAKVLTQETKPDEPVDLTGNTFVTGNADQFAGGFTAGNGTNPNAVHSLPSPTGVPGGTGTPQAAPPPPPPGPDRSRAPSLGGGLQWSCPFPPEADTAQIDDAFVSLQVDVSPDGSPTAARITADPGNGFGREARRCAMMKHYQSALDHDGNPIPGIWKARVHFSR